MQRPTEWDVLWTTKSGQFESNHTHEHMFYLPDKASSHLISTTKHSRSGLQTVFIRFIAARAKGSFFFHCISNPINCLLSLDWMCCTRVCVRVCVSMFRCAKSATVFVSFFANLNRIKLQNTMKFAFSSNQRHAMEISCSLSRSFRCRGHTHTRTHEHTHTRLAGRQKNKQYKFCVHYCIVPATERAMFIVPKIFSAFELPTGARVCVWV